MDSAASANPATNAPVPSTPCTYVGTYELSPISSAPTPNVASVPPVSTRLRNTHSGSTGSWVRDSTSTNDTSSAVATTNSTMLVADVHDQPTPPSSNARMSSEQPAVSVPAPAK